MKITILDDIYLNYDKARLAKLGEVKYFTRLEKNLHGNDAELIKRIDDSDIVVSCHVALNKNVIESCSNLKYIITSSTGVDNIDVEAANKNGILVSNIPNYGTSSVAQATVALLLEVVNRVANYNEYVRSDMWNNGLDWSVVKEDLIELDNKTAGIIGYGEIGKATAKILESLGMSLITYDVNDDTSKLDKLLAESDVISLHCPLTKDNKYMINRSSIDKMKDGVILINTSRGSLVNSDDLYEALKNGKIYFAAFDVVDGEPIGKTHPLLSLPNFILTPHVAWATKEARKRIVDLVSNNIECYINEKPINLIK
ncbi:MAG: NAD(P)-dependent oxidoreductase [Bacilli bacterium]